MIKHHSYKTTCAPRGITKGIQAQQEADQDSTHLTLKQLVDSRYKVVEVGFAHMQGYTERNTTFIVQKAYGIQMFGCLVLQEIGIVSSSEMAAAYNTSFCAWTN